MDIKTINIALAGLLHDIGKVEQRAQDDPRKPPEGLPLEGQPVHAKWTKYFIKNTIPKVYQAAAYQGVNHHRPEKSPAEGIRISMIISLADKLSAGERVDEVKDGKGDRPPQQLLSIFDRLSSFRDDSHQRHFLPLEPLTLNKTAIFPGSALSSANQVSAYKNLRDLLAEEIKREISDPETYLENTLAVIERTTWCVPSAYYHSLPDVSLYDHSRMTAALSVCLAEFPVETLQNMLASVRRSFNETAKQEDLNTLNQSVAMLVGGDISGIQDFIYTLSSKGAAKTLRGRSLYLQLLTEAVLRYVLRELEIPYTNVIYAGGGHFFLLAPLSAAGKLPGIQQYITRTLLHHHGSSLYLALGTTDVPTSGFRVGMFPKYWDEMHAALAATKQHRYQELGDDLIERIFQPKAHGGNREKTCSICGAEKEGTSLQEKDEGGEEVRMCPLCKSFENPLGKYLPETRHLYLAFGKPQECTPGTALDVLASFGMQIQMFDKDVQPLIRDHSIEGAERAVTWALEDRTASKTWPESGSLPSARKIRYMVNRIPPCTFDELQKESKGMKRLGVLRMDVDDVGKLFKTGFGETGKDSIASLARLSSLSFQLSLFFEGWIKKICETTSPLIYTVYSGGDDLFLIAPWHIVPDLAAKISTDFGKYSCDNPDVHISGGMAFIHGKYPVYQVAEDAHAALEVAKKCEGKNSFSFLGQAWNWKQFEDLTGKYQQLVQIVNQLGGPRSLLQLLQQLASQAAEKARKHKGKPVWGPWMWLGEYQFRRMLERADKQSQLAAALNAVHQDLSPFYYPTINQWGVAARWAQIYLRDEKEHKGG